MKIIKFEEDEYLLIDGRKGRWSVVEGQEEGLEERINQNPEKYFPPVSREKILEENRDYPLTLVVLHTSDICNLRCTYCSAEPKNKEKFSPETGKKLVDLIKNSDSKMIHFEFHGGEPLTNFDFIKEFVVYSQKELLEKKVTYSLQSNGTLLDNKKIDFLIENQIGIGLSLDGTREVNDRQRGRGTFDKVVANIEKLRKKGKNFGIISVLTEINQFEDIYNLINNYGLESISVNYCFPQGKARGREDFNWSEMADATLKFTDRLVNYNSKQEKKVRFKNISSIAKKLITERQTYMCMRSPCGAGITQIAVNPQGNIYPCHRMLNNEETRLGNIGRIDKIENYLRNSNVVNFLRSRTPEKIYGCRDCYLDKFCSSGCPSEQIARGEDLFQKPSKCDFYKKMISGIMIRLYQNFEGIKSLS